LQKGIEGMSKFRNFRVGAILNRGGTIVKPIWVSLRLYHYSGRSYTLLTGNPDRSNYSNHAINYSN